MKCTYNEHDTDGTGVGLISSSHISNLFNYICIFFSFGCESICLSILAFVLSQTYKSNVQLCCSNTLHAPHCLEATPNHYEWWSWEVDMIYWLLRMRHTVVSMQSELKENTNDFALSLVIWKSFTLKSYTCLWTSKADSFIHQISIFLLG